MHNDDGVRRERTAWRDEALSQRHREWGFNCPMLDIDFLAVEYDTGIPVALVEYKNEHAPKQLATHPSYQALITVGNRAQLPVFAVRYATSFEWWFIVPLNRWAKDVQAERVKMTEREYIGFLYRLRGRDYDDAV